MEMMAFIVLSIATLVLSNSSVSVLVGACVDDSILHSFLSPFVIRIFSFVWMVYTHSLEQLLKFLAFSFPHLLFAFTCVNITILQEES